MNALQCIPERGLGRECVFSIALPRNSLKYAKLPQIHFDKGHSLFSESKPLEICDRICDAISHYTHFAEMKAVLIKVTKGIQTLRKRRRHCQKRQENRKAIITFMFHMFHISSFFTEGMQQPCVRGKRPQDCNSTFGMGTRVNTAKPPPPGHICARGNDVVIPRN